MCIRDRHKEHADGLGAPLVGPLFNKGHENDGQDGREHLSAVSDVLQLDAEEVSTTPVSYTHL